MAETTLRYKDTIPTLHTQMSIHLPTAQFSILKSTVKISFLYEYSIQDQPIDYNVEKADDQNSDEDIYNFLDDYYTEVDADEVKENSEIQSNDYRE